MIRALRTAATGMRAQQMNVDTIANNLANINTTGFKRTRINFQDLMYQNLRIAGSPTSDGQIPTGLQVGLGVRAAATQKIFSQGPLQQTDNPMDLAIEGQGFFQVTLPDGSYAYTRDGSFKRDAQGNLVTSDGYPVDPSIVVPSDATMVTVSPDGTVSAQIPGQSTPQVLGQLNLVSFANPPGLDSMGKDLYRQTAASGDPVTGVPGLEGLGTLSQGFVEKSNVDVVAEMVDMITAQRAYEINAKVIKGADEMLQVVGNLVQ